MNESHGPALAMLFVAPSQDHSEVLPRLFAEAVDRLGVEEAGSLFLGNYDDLTRLALEERRPLEDLVEAFDLLAGQPEVVRKLASDSGLIVRLLLERRGREPIGAEILSRCGPEAADLLFEAGGYAKRPEEKAAALAILARLGWPGVELLHAFRDDAWWHRLLRRTDLMEPYEEPLIVRIAGKLRSSPRRQDDIERYLDMPREQILEDEWPKTFLGGALEWIPGYVAVHTAYNAAKGYRIETSEVAWAVIDAAMTVSLVGELAGQAIKTVGRQAVKAEAEAAMRIVEGQAAREMAATGSRQAARTVLRQIPGALPSLTRSLAMRLPTLDVTSVMRSASGIARKVGVRTWGKLDRRIIMRGDRRVVIDLFAPKVVKIVGEELSEAAVNELRKRITESTRWDTAPTEAGEIGPCIMEQVVPGLSIKTEEWASELSRETAVSRSPRPLQAGVMPKLGGHPVFLGIELASILACLALSASRVRRAIGRAFRWILAAPEAAPSGQRPRSYRE